MNASHHIAPRVPIGDAVLRPFQRNQRRRHSTSTVVTASGAALKPEMFERLWSAHASTSSWQRSFIPANTDSLLTSFERAQLHSAFVDDALHYSRSATAVSRPTIASPGQTSEIPDGVAPVPAQVRTTSAEPFSPVTGSSTATTKAEALLSSLYVNDEGARRIRDIIAKALRLTWLVSAEDVLAFMKAVVLDSAPSVENSMADQSSPTNASDAESLAVDWSHVRVTEDHVLSIAKAVKQEAASRRSVSLAVPLGHSAGTQEDPYAAADEVVSAFASLGGQPDLSGKALWHDTTKLLTSACVDEGTLLELTTKRNNRSHRAGETTAPAAGDGAASSSGSLPSASHYSKRHRGSDTSELSDRSVASRHSSIAAPQATGDGTMLPLFDDEEEPGLTFREFQALLAVDPWKAAAARIFTTLGGVPYDPTSTVAFDKVAVAYERMLLIELSPETAASFVERLAQVVDPTHGFTFDTFENTVVVTLRRVCAGGMASDGGSRSGGQANAAAGGTAGSAGLLRMLTYQPSFGPKTFTTKQILSRVDALMAEAKRHRDEYRRIRNKTSTLFQVACVLQGTPLSHLAKLTRRRLLYFVNMITQRRTFNLCAPNDTIERFLRCLTAAAHVLRDHSVQCKSCQALAIAVKPAAERRVRRPDDKKREAPSPSDASDLASQSTPLRTMSPARAPPPSTTTATHVLSTRSQPLNLRPSAHANRTTGQRSPKGPQPWSNGGISTARRYVGPSSLRAVDVLPSTPRQPLPPATSVLSRGTSRRTEDNFIRSIFKRAQYETSDSRRNGTTNDPSWSV